MKIRILTFRCRYWRPGTDYISYITNRTGKHVQDGDIIAVSEKAISTAMGNIADESKIKPGKVAKFLSTYYTTRLWGGPIGKIIGFKDQTLKNLRNYPAAEGAAHKQLALSEVGLLQSLRHYSEGGIDASNLPYAYVSLPLHKPSHFAAEIRKHIQEKTGKQVSVMIMDGDTTYSWRNLHLAPRKVQTPGLIHFGGVLIFIIGRLFNFKARQTPIAIAGKPINPDRCLWYARLFHRLSGGGAGRTAWSMSVNLETSLTGVTWEMLESVEHYPVSIIRELN
ncbi:coenzyme F420-0:L-glutamate ligase [Thermoproteota archaeon]